MDRRAAIRLLTAATALPFVSLDELASLVEARRTIACDPFADRFRPAALSEPQLAIVKTCADIILPATDTPAASEVGVHEFIDTIVSEWFDTTEAERFLEGLEELNQTAMRLYETDFVDCAPADQVALVSDLDADLTQLRETEGDLDASFFHWMKRLTLTGYFTSEEGMTALQHRRIPGAFPGCRVPEPAQ